MDEITQLLNEKYKKNIKYEGYIEYTEIVTPINNLKLKFYYVQNKIDQIKVVINYRGIWAEVNQKILADIISEVEIELKSKIVNDISNINIDNTPFKIEIEGKEFILNGLNIDNYSKNIQLYFPMDFEVSIKELVILINILYERDKEFNNSKCSFNSFFERLKEI